MNFFIAPQVWLALAFIFFVFILYRAGVFQKLGVALDSYSQKVSDELQQARLMREEAEMLLHESQKRIHAVQEEADLILERARKASDQMLYESEVFLQKQTALKKQEMEDKVVALRSAVVRDVSGLVIKDVFERISKGISSNSISVDKNIFLGELLDVLKKTKNCLDNPETSV